MEAEHAVVGLLQAAVVYVHLIGCAADHLTLSHQRLIGQELRCRASVSHDGQRLLLGKVDFLHLRRKKPKHEIQNTSKSLDSGNLVPGSEKAEDCVVIDCIGVHVSNGKRENLSSSCKHTRR